MNEAKRQRKHRQRRQVMMLVAEPVGHRATDGGDEILPERVARVIDIDRPVKIERDQKAKDTYRHPVVDRMHLKLSNACQKHRRWTHGRECLTGKVLLAALLCIGTVVLTGCDKSAPTGQVVAVANGEEITSGELDAEARLREVSNTGDAAVRAALLGEIVDRKLWAQAARHDKLDQTVQFVLARRRAEDALLADIQLHRVTRSVTPPSETEIETFLRAHPKAFASRTTFSIDQIDVRSGSNAALEEELAGAKSLDEVSAILAHHGIVGPRSRTEWNSMFMPARLAARLTEMPLKTVFMQRDGPTLIAAIVIARTDIPLGEVDRTLLARQELTQHKVSVAVASRLAALHTAAKIQLQPGYALAGAAAP